ncbi:MAG: hypothetical protein ACO1NM_00405 [Sphingobium phenoxybenzoativorans]
MNATSRKWGGFLQNWLLLALAGIIISIPLFLLPLGLGFSGIWSATGWYASIQRCLALIAALSPYIFWLSMIAAWPISWRVSESWALKIPLWLIPVQLLLIIIMIIAF